MSIQALNTRKNEIYAAQEAILNSVQESKRSLTVAENEQIDRMTAEATDIEKQVVTLSAIAAGRAGLALPTSQIVVPQADSKKSGMSAEYLKAFYGSFKNRQFVNAALGEGGTTDGGYLVPTIGPEGAITPLAPNQATMRKLATVIPTTNDIKFAIQATKSVAAAKAESRTGDNAFSSTNPTFTQVTLSAYMSGAFVPVTIELSQDVAALQPFLSGDLSRGVNNYEEDKFVNGNGSGQPQGILAGATAAQTAAIDAAGNAALDLTGALNPVYYPNAQWLMHRQTAIALKKKQLTANQFNQYFTSQNGVDYLHGFKINYSSAMPVYAASPLVNGKIVFGDFSAAMTIGDRGGPALQVVTDNITQLENGVIRYYGYRRTDSRVLLPEAAQVWTVNG